MRPPHENRIRKKRRWLLIAVAALLLVFLGTWALSPRVDPRLVGEWEFVPPRSRIPQPEFALEIRPDGMVDHLNLPGPREPSGASVTVQAAGPMQFQISGDHFDVLADDSVGLARFFVKLRNLIRGRRPSVITSGRIVSVDESKLVLKFEDPEELQFVRVKSGTLNQRLLDQSGGGPVMASPGASRESGR